jgi:hypothetical protein
MNVSFQLLERQTLIAPLGVKFWDVATGAYVSDGLNVTAYPDNDRLHSTQAAPNRSGTYVLHHAAGLRDFEMGAGNLLFTDSLPARRPFTVEVRDEQRRFLPLRFGADLPFKGLFELPAGLPSDLSVGSGVPLFSSTLRTAPAGMALLRAELYEAPSVQPDGVLTSKPAAWAMLEARTGGELLGRGIADELGRIVLIFAYPKPHDSISSSGSSPAPPFTAGLPFLQQEWAIQLDAYYEPLSVFSPLTPLSPNSATSIPNLSDLVGQSSVNLFLDEALTEPLTEVTLMYGPKVFVFPSSSPLSSPLDRVPLSILFVRPAGSPPS